MQTAKAIKKDKGHYIIIKRTIKKEDITINNTNTHNIKTQIITDINRETDGNTIIVGDFNIPLTSMERSSTQKMDKSLLINQQRS